MALRQKAANDSFLVPITIAHAGIDRTVLRWLDSLNLSQGIKSPRRDLSNGFLIAEILAHYFPDEMELHSFDTGRSMDNKFDNWQQLKRTFAKHNIALSEEDVNGFIDSDLQCSMRVLEELYRQLAKRPIKTSRSEQTLLTPQSYAFSQQPYERQTAIKLIKTQSRALDSATKDETKKHEQMQHLLSDHETYLKEMKVREAARIHLSPRRQLILRQNLKQIASDYPLTLPLPVEGSMENLSQKAAKP